MQIAPNELRALAVVHEAIDEAIKGRPSEVFLRPDAKLFLIVNLHQLVTLPLSDPRSPTPLNDEVEQGIKSDVKTILKSSLQEASRRERYYIAASHIVWGLANVLDELSLKSWRLWENDE